VPIYTEQSLNTIRASFMPRGTKDRLRQLRRLLSPYATTASRRFETSLKRLKCARTYRSLRDGAAERRQIDHPRRNCRRRCCRLSCAQWSSPHQSPTPGFGEKNWNLSGFPSQSLESGGGGFFIVMFGQTFVYSAFSRNHFSSPGSVASTGHSGTQTPQSPPSAG
jgi:hypothetical protein